MVDLSVTFDFSGTTSFFTLAIVTLALHFFHPIIAFLAEPRETNGQSDLFGILTAGIAETSRAVSLCRNFSDATLVSEFSARTRKGSYNCPARIRIHPQKHPHRYPVATLRCHLVPFQNLVYCEEDLKSNSARTSHPESLGTPFFNLPVNRRNQKHILPLGQVATINRDLRRGKRLGRCRVRPSTTSVSKRIIFSFTVRQCCFFYPLSILISDDSASYHFIFPHFPENLGTALQKEKTSFFFFLSIPQTCNDDRG